MLKNTQAWFLLCMCVCLHNTIYKQCINTGLVEVGCDNVTWIELALDHNQ
jgi:hypothetical protein